jgi:uncharacterized protein DUF4296
MKYSWIKLLVILISASVISACSNKSKVPSDVLPPSKMEKVLWDIMVADRFATQFIVKDSAKKNVTDETFKLYSQVFSINDVTRQEFVRSYKFYMTRPDLSKTLYDTILQRANRMKEDIYRPKVPPDSLGKPADTTRRDTVAP